MLVTRVIPTLLLKNTGLVKGIKYTNHKYIGDPINAVKIFNEKEVDEIIRLKPIPVTIDNLGGWSRQLRAWGYKDIPDKYLVM